jgi:hypothetical protein
MSAPDEAKRIEREYDHTCRTNPMFKEFVEFCPSMTMQEALESWEWVKKLVEKAIARTVRDLTSPPPHATLGQKRDR